MGLSTVSWVARIWSAASATEATTQVERHDFGGGVLGAGVDLLFLGGLGLLPDSAPAKHHVGAGAGEFVGGHRPSPPLAPVTTRWRR